APITIERPFCSTPLKPSTSERSISAGGLASRSFITGKSECPPASSLASGFRDSRPAAWRTVVGPSKVKFDIDVPLSPLTRLPVPERRPHSLSRGRHCQFFRPYRIGNGIDHRRRRSDRACLATAFDAKRIRGGLGFGQANFKRWNIMGVRHAVVHQRSRHQLTVLIVDRAFQKGLPNSLRDASVHLAFHDHRIDYGAEVIDYGPVDNFGFASVAVYFDFTDVTASRESEVGRIVEARLL